MNDSLSKIVYFFVVKPIIYLKIFLIYSRKVNLIRLETSFIMSTELILTVATFCAITPSYIVF